MRFIPTLGTLLFVGFVTLAATPKKNFSEADYLVAVLNSEVLLQEAEELVERDLKLESLEIKDRLRCPGCYRIEASFGNSEESYVVKLGTRLDLETNTIQVNGEKVKKTLPAKKNSEINEFYEAVLGSDVLLSDLEDAAGNDLYLKSIALTATMRCMGCYEFEVTFSELVGPIATISTYATRLDSEGKIEVKAKEERTRGSRGSQTE